jgi:hypothetical protein
MNLSDIEVEGERSQIVHSFHWNKIINKLYFIINLKTFETPVNVEKEQQGKSTNKPLLNKLDNNREILLFSSKTSYKLVFFSLQMIHGIPSEATGVV